MPPPTILRQIQSLNGCLDSLRRFVSKLAEKSIPFFDALKGVNKSREVQWTSSCQEAFDSLKNYLSSPPIPSQPLSGETLYLYLSVALGAVRSCLVYEEGYKQFTAYYVSHVLRDAETRYPTIEKMAYSILLASRLLRPYFQGHDIKLSLSVVIELSPQKLSPQRYAQGNPVSIELSPQKLSSQRYAQGNPIAIELSPQKLSPQRYAQGNPVAIELSPQKLSPQGYAQGNSVAIELSPQRRDNYNLWKKKMMLFMKASNPLYIGILLNGPYVLMEVIVESTTATGVRIPSSSTPRDPSKYTKTDKELINLDTSLQLIIVKSADNDISHQLLGSNSAKDMWDIIELLMEGTEEVKEIRMDILMTQYEAFKLQPGEALSSLFERYTRLLSELKLQGKVYPIRESNRKFMLTLSFHLEQKNTSIRERADFITMSLDVIYNKLRTHELEQEQRAIIYGPGSIDKDESELYTQEELEQLEDKSMAYMAAKFSHVRFRRKPNYKPRSSSGRFQKGSYSSGSSSRGGYKSSWIDKSKTRCYNCNELGHFTSDCRKPKAVKSNDSYEKKETYEDLKRKNEKLKQKLNAYVVKEKGRAYIAEGKSWDDTDSDEEKKLYNVHTSMLAYKMENDKLVLKSESLTSRNEELELLVVGLEDLKQKNEYLENKVKCNADIEAILRTQIVDLEKKLQAFKNAALTQK
ncbi:hypothetical protein AgCh_008060 [Apium graveolens]